MTHVDAVCSIDSHGRRSRSCGSPPRSLPIDLHDGRDAQLACIELEKRLFLTFFLAFLSLFFFSSVTLEALSFSGAFPSLLCN